VRVPRDAGDATLAPFDGLRNAKGGTPTEVLRLEMQRQGCREATLQVLRLIELGRSRISK